MTTPATDPSTLALISGGMALGGVVIGGVINYLLSRQRAKEEREALEKRLAHERETFERRLQHEERDRDVRIKLEAIERAYKLLADIRLNTREAVNFSLSIVDEGSKEKGFYDDWNRTSIRAVSDLRSIGRLYVPEIKELANNINEVLLNIVKKYGDHQDILAAGFDGYQQTKRQVYVQPEGSEVPIVNFSKHLEDSAKKYPLFVET